MTEWISNIEPLWAIVLLLGVIAVIMALPVVKNALAVVFFVLFIILFLAYIYLCAFVEFVARIFRKSND